MELKYPRESQSQGVLEAAFAIHAPYFQLSIAPSISGIVIALGVLSRDCTASLSNHFSPRTTGTEEGPRAGMSAGQFPAPAGCMRPGCASCKMYGVPPGCAISAPCYPASKCGDARKWEWQTTSPARTEISAADTFWHPKQDFSDAWRCAANSFRSAMLKPEKGSPRRA